MTVLDGLVVFVYFAMVGFVAWRAAGRQESTRDYFLGGRSLPWWAATLSIVATETSAVTFIGVPAAGYRGDWSFLQLVLGFVVGRVLLARFFVRAFYQHDYETVYALLEHRFGNWVRALTGMLFLAGRLFASGVRLFAGCLAAAVAIDVAAAGDVTTLITTILAVGLFGTAFTLYGGIRGVVWTDVLLGATFILSALAAGAYIFAQLPAELPAELSAQCSDKLRVWHFEWNGLGDASSFYAGLLGGTVLTLATHGTDQDIAQRMLTCRDSSQGARSVIGSAFLIVPQMIMFLGLGTLLWLFYQTRTVGYTLPEQPNHLLPTFIVRELPPGLTGFVLAGLLAASLSSLTSALNALASVTVSDFYRPFARTNTSPEGELMVARTATLFWGVALTGMALLLMQSEDNILNLALKVLTYFYGAILGVFLLALFTRRGSALSLTIGVVVSVTAVLTLQLREFAVDPKLAPAAVQAVMEALSEDTIRFLKDLPAVGWPYWVVLGTGITMGIGALGRSSSDRR